MLEKQMIQVLQKQGFSKRSATQASKAFSQWAEEYQVEVGELLAELTVSPRSKVGQIPATKLNQLVTKLSQAALDMSLLGFKCRWVYDSKTDEYLIEHNFKGISDHSLYLKVIQLKKEVLTSLEADRVVCRYVTLEEWQRRA